MFKYLPRLTTATYFCILILFFLPFINIKCNHEELMRVKGIELATGFRIGNPPDDAIHNKVNTEGKFDDDLDIERNNFATASLLLAIGGLVLSFLMQWKKEMLQGIIGLAGMMSLFLMRVQLDSKYPHTTGIPVANSDKLIDNNIIIEYEAGYWLVVICFLLITAINIHCYMEQMKNGKLEISDGYPDG